MEIATLSSSSASFLRTAYARMLLTRMVDECAWKLYEQGRSGFVASSRGHEAAQVGSALCIEVGKDFTLPYYRDLGVVLTIGMTSYEVLRTYLLAHARTAESSTEKQTTLHWGYQKHNMVTGPAPVATQILHAAGIAFACKLRKTTAVTVAYCGDGATTEPDFLEGITFAAQHNLPVVFICEQDCAGEALSSLQSVILSIGMKYRRIDGSNVRVVYEMMQAAMQYVRAGNGPILLEIGVNRSEPGEVDVFDGGRMEEASDPLLCCRRLLEEQGEWDEQWVSQLYARLKVEVEQALQDAVSDLSKED